MNTKLVAPAADLIDQFISIVGPKGAITAPDELAPYLHEWRDRYVGRTSLLLKPANVAEVSAILALANQAGVAIVPQGGNTGLVGGQIPFEDGHEIVLNLSRLNRIRSIDTNGNTITVEAGVTLKAVQDAAETEGRLFPLSLGAEGSCQIGGNLSTNAGGVAVLRYGSMRDLTLGLEAVFADGQIWNGLKSLRKDNTGYDLKNLLIGAEGTLGVITAATLKLFARPAEVVTAFVGFPDLKAVAAFFSRTFEGTGPLLTAFELIPRIGIDFLIRHTPNIRDPFGEPHAWYALVEVSSPWADERAAELLSHLLETALEHGEIEDATIAASDAQASDFWRMREILSEVQKHEGGSIKNDISVPVSSIPAFIEAANDAVVACVPGARPVPFGHFGDGNIHYNISQPVGADKNAFLSQWDAVVHTVNDVVLSFGGSISAEHGIGRMKAQQLAAIKSPVEIEIMRRIKTALDPNGILNPGKVLL